MRETPKRLESSLLMTRLASQAKQFLKRNWLCIPKRFQSQFACHPLLSSHSRAAHYLCFIPVGPHERIKLVFSVRFSTLCVDPVPRFLQKFLFLPQMTVRPSLYMEPGYSQCMWYPAALLFEASPIFSRFTVCS